MALLFEDGPTRVSDGTSVLPTSASVEWSAKITRMNNGYVVHLVCEEQSDLLVFQEMEEGKVTERFAELECFQDVVQQLMSHFGLHNSKHEKYNFHLSITGKDPASYTRKDA